MANGKKKKNQATKKLPTIHNIFQVAKNGTIDILDDILPDKEDFNRMCEKRDEHGLTPLHYAAKFNQINAITRLVTCGADVDVRGIDEITPLHVAARHNHSEAAKTLLSLQAKSDTGDDDGDTPLHVAAKLGYPNVCKILIEHNPSLINKVNKDKVTPLHIACRRNRLLVCQLLIGNAANAMLKSVDGSLPIHFAASKGSCEIIELLLDIAASRSEPKTNHLAMQDNEGKTALHRAVQGGHVKAAIICLHSGSDIMATMNDGLTPLHVAASIGSPTLTRILLKDGAQINAKCVIGRTPIHLASSFGHTSVIKILLNQGAEINIVDDKFQTPLMVATENGNLSSINELIYQGADVSVVDDQNRNCLHLASRAGHLEALIAIFKHGGQGYVDILDSLDRTPIHYAAEAGHHRIIELLLANDAGLEFSDADDNLPIHLACKSANIASVKVLCDKSLTHLNSPGERSRTPLHHAIVNNLIPIVDFLIKYGANVNKRDGSYRTPLLLAAERGYFDITKILLENNAAINDRASDGKTALHAAATSDNIEITEFLLANGAEILSDNDNRTCLDIAIENQSKNVAMAIVKQKKIKDLFMKVDEEGRTVMQRLVEQLPDAAQMVMDRCITRSKHFKGRQSREVTYDFSFIDPGPTFEEENFLVNQDDKKTSINCNAVQTMRKLKRGNLVNHELSKALLDYKWRKFGAYVFYANLSIYVIYLSLLTHFTVSLKASPKNNSFSSAFNPAPVTVAPTTSSITLPDNSSIFSTITTDRVPRPFNIVIQVSVLVFSIINLLKECYQLLHLGFAYFKNIGNYMEIFMYISTLILITPPGRVPNDWQWLFGSFALFLSWINLLLFMERISALGIYVIMLKSVLLTFLRILVVLTIFMVAFAFAFTILAGSEDVFSTISLAMIKVLDMMVGEIDYKDVFVTAISGRTIKYPDNYVLVAFLVIFIFLMPILLMNLMIGLAIGDIDKIQRNANIRRLGIQIDFLDDLERSLPRWLRKKFHCAKDIRNTQKYLYKFYAYVYGEVTSKNEEDVEEFYIEQIDRVLTELDWQKKQIRGIFTEMDKMMETILEIQSFQEFSHHAPKGGSMQSEDSKKSEGPKALLSPEASDTSDEKTYL